jgi:EAL domain-containing protein (putative c-di-GMP-specific phosphodiesterase class I)
MVVLFRRQPLASEIPKGGLSIQAVVRNRYVGCDFQPIVRLDGREVVGFEALARGPEGTEWQRPAAMFAAAEEAGLTWELDLTAHAAAFTAAAEADLPPSLALFINADPASLGRTVPDDLGRALVAARPKVQVFMELSERALCVDAGATLANVDRARASGWGLSLDNVGVTLESLAMLPFARPDVVKIDVSLVHAETHPHAARVVDAITAHAQRTGASIMALGIETEAHLRTARGLGATLGQGYLFGRPGPLPRQVATPVGPIPRIAAEAVPAADDTPFRLATATAPALSASTSLFTELAGHLEQRAVLDPDPTMVVACLPRNELPSGAPLAFLQMMARSASFAAAAVGSPPTHRLPDVRTVTLGRADALRDELVLILVGPHFSAMLAARERFAGRPESGYEYRLSYDRPTVIRAAHLILHRLPSSSPSR